MDQTSSTGGRPARPLSLLDLPGEVLEQIFDDVYYRNWSKPDAPLCRQLRPYHTRGLFRWIHLDEGNRVAALIETVQRRPDHGALIETLEVSIDESEGPLAGVGGLPFAAVFLAFLHQVPNLQVLCFVGPAKLARAILDPARASLPDFMPKLNWLRVSGGARTSPRQPYNLPAIAALRAYPHLRYLSLETLEFPGPRRLLVTSITSLPPLSHVTSLEIRPSKSHPDMAAFLSLFDNLATLRFYQFYNYTPIDLYLSAVRSPSRVRHLEVFGGLDGIAWPLDTLARFTSLTYLRLTYDLEADTAFFNTLRHLPLHHLVVEPAESGFSLPACTEFVHGPRQHPTLRTLEIDYPYNYASASIADHPLSEFEFDSEGKGRHRLRGNWELPEWTEGFSREDCRELVAAAARPGAVQLKARVTTALQTEEEHALEAKMLAQMVEADRRRRKRSLASGAWPDQAEE
ncbi:hypothetical protein JCM6882_008080 [Rhodosporidiobolus microsporus]